MNIGGRRWIDECFSYHVFKYVIFWYDLGPPQENMANPKEKTPMCLVNELARFNRIQPQYKLLNERGPAHAKVKKKFFRCSVIMSIWNNI